MRRCGRWIGRGCGGAPQGRLLAAQSFATIGRPAMVRRVQGMDIHYMAGPRSTDVLGIVGPRPGYCVPPRMRTGVATGRVGGVLVWSRAAHWTPPGEQEPTPRVHHFNSSQAELDRLVDVGELDRATRLAYDMLDWLPKQRKHRPEMAVEIFDQTLATLTRLATIFLRHQNYSEGLRCIGKVMKMRRNNFNSFKETLSDPRRMKTLVDTTIEREMQKNQVKNILDYASALVTFGHLIMGQRTRLKLDTAGWENTDEPETMLQTVERELVGAKEILASPLIDNFLSAYDSESMRVMSPFSSVLVSPTVLMIETKQQQLNIAVACDLMLARVYQERKNYAEAQNILQQCLNTVEQELGNLAVQSPLLAAIFTQIADTRLSLYLQGEAAQHGVSSGGSEESAHSDKTATSPTSAGTRTKKTAVLSFSARDEYLDELDALLKKALSIFDVPQDLETFPEYAVHCRYLRGKVLAVRSKIYQEAIEMFALLMPENNKIPTARREQTIVEQATKFGDIATNLLRMREEGEQLLKEAFRRQKALYGTQFHPNVTECLIDLLQLLAAQPAKVSEATRIAEETFEHLEFFRTENPTTARLYSVLAEVKEASGGFQNAEEFRKKAIRSWKAVRGTLHPVTLFAQEDLFNLYVLQKRWKEAEEGLTMVAREWKRRMGQGAPVQSILADIMHDIGILNVHQDSTGEALKLLVYAHKLVAGEKNEDEFFTRRITASTIEDTLGWTLYAEQQLEQALPHLKSSAEMLEWKYDTLKKLPMQVRELLLDVVQEKRRRTGIVPLAPATSPSQHGKGSAGTEDITDTPNDDDTDEGDALEEELSSIPRHVKEEMKDTIDTSLGRLKAKQKDPAWQKKREEELNSLVKDIEADDQPSRDWDTTEEALLKALKAVVEISIITGDQPHLFERFAQKAVDVAGDMYGYLEDPSRPKPRDDSNNLRRDHATQLREHLMNYGHVLQLQNRIKEAEFCLTRAEILDNQYNREERL